MSERELDRLMARLSRGDREAFDPLFRALRPRAVRLVRARLGEAGDDVAQAALLKVFARASEFRAGMPVLPWFYAIVANELRAHLRTRGRSGEAVDSAGSTLVDATDPERELMERELARALDTALDRLDGPAAESIATLLGDCPHPVVAAATFRKRLSRAYADLRLLLEGLYGD